jgi:lysophospholipase L1-like esterase
MKSKFLKRIRRILLNLLLSVISLIIFFSLAEIAARLLWHPDARNKYTGVILSGSNRQIIHEGVEYKINSLGLRMNREIEPIKPNGLRHILVLGDSFIFGDGITFEDLITEKMKENLNAEFGNIEVINAGVGGYNTSDELKQLIRLTPVCQPDLVIVFFFTNDVIKESQDPQKASWQQRIKEYLRVKSKFFAFLYYIYKDKLSSKIGVPKVFLAPEYFNLNDSKPGWVSFKKAVLQIQKHCFQHDAELLFVIIPTLTNLDERYPYAELRTKTSNFLNDCNIQCIDLFDLFAPYKPSELWVNLENTHWNGLGTSLAAKEIVNYIKENRLLKVVQ